MRLMFTQQPQVLNLRQNTRQDTEWTQGLMRFFLDVILLNCWAVVVGDEWS